MPAGGFKTFVAGEILTAADTNSFLMQGVLVFDDAAARDAAITSPVEGQFVFRTDEDVLEFFDGTEFVELAVDPLQFQYVVVAGGGAGAPAHGAGGGAGGYLSNVPGENSGGGSAAKGPLFVDKGTPFLVTVGAGGAGGTGGAQNNTAGSISELAGLIAYGGGQGTIQLDANRFFGGSGGGGGAGTGSVGQGIQLQGFRGGFGAGSGTTRAGGGGGGAVSVGTNGSPSVGGSGGSGLSSSITGTATFRAGGGAGTNLAQTSGTGGVGGGGNANTAGATNTGGGGGASSGGTSPSGGSGVVIIKYSDSITLSVGAGLTQSTAAAGGFKTTIFTAGTDTVTIP